MSYITNGWNMTWFAYYGTKICTLKKEKLIRKRKLKRKSKKLKKIIEKIKASKIKEKLK